jgi:hypothetical protein
MNTENLEILESDSDKILNKILAKFRNDEEVFFSDLFLGYTPIRAYFRFNKIEDFIKLIYNNDFIHGSLWFNFFCDYLDKHQISPLEVEILQDEIIKFEDPRPENLTRQFARLERIKVVLPNSEEFNTKKYNTFRIYKLVDGEEKVAFDVGIDKRFKYENFNSGLFEINIKPVPKYRMVAEI